MAIDVCELNFDVGKFVCDYEEARFHFDREIVDVTRSCFRSTMVC